MSVPPLVIYPTTISNSYQIATPFTHTIINEFPVPPGFDYLGPNYTVPTGGSSGGSGAPGTPGASGSTGTSTFVSRATSNTTVIVIPDNANSGFMLEGIEYDVGISNDISNGDSFEFTLPTAVTEGGPSGSNTTNGRMEFLNGFEISFTSSTFANGSISYLGSNETYPLGSRLVHTYVSSNTSFTVTLVRPGTSTLTLASNFGIPYGPQFVLKEMTWTVPAATVLPYSWDAAELYDSNDVVYYKGGFYITFESNNRGNEPDTTYPAWFLTSPGGFPDYSPPYPEWNAVTTYSRDSIIYFPVKGSTIDRNGDIIQTTTLTYYTSLSNGNVNNQPDIDTRGNWIEGAVIPPPPVYSAWSSSTTYASNADVSFSNFNYRSLQNANSNNPPATSLNSWALANNSNAVFTIRSPIRTTSYPAAFPTLEIGGLTSPAVLPFIKGAGTTIMEFSSLTGFQSAPLSNQILQINQTVIGSEIASTSYTFNVTPIEITITPVLTSPLSTVTYKPFIYYFSIPIDVVNVQLQSNALVTSSSLTPFIQYNGPFEIIFSSDVGFTSSGSSIIEIDAVLNSNDIITSNVSTINIQSSVITTTPPVPTGSLSLFKFEPFRYTFTTNLESVGVILQFNRSSSSLQTFCSISEDQRTVIFTGTFLTSSSSYTLSLIIDLVYDGTIIDSTTILITVGQARFFPPSAGQNFQLFQYENVSNTFGSNIVFSTVTPITTIISQPSLPTGLTFGGSGNSFFIQGAPVLQVPQSNYQVVGSNSNNGRIVTSTISLRVNPQTVRITPNTSTLTGLIVDSPIEPIILTAVQPATIYQASFVYTWSGLPDGFNFQDINGSNVSFGFSPSDPNLTIVLTGSPSIAFATFMSTLSSNLYQMRLTGTRTDQTGAQIVGTSLFNFSMGETVLINVSNSATLYQSKPLAATDVLITAGSFFSSAIISNIIAEELPPGLSLVQYSSPNVYRLTGTPTQVNLTGSYTFTATNTTGNSRSVTAVIPINPDIVSFVGSTPANGEVIQFIVSRPLINAKTGYYTTPIVFTATSTADATPIVYTASIDFTAYGLVLNSSTGTLTGIPNIPLSTTTVTITATDTLGTTGLTTIQLTILADEFEWPVYTPTYFQNKLITPFQFVMTSTLSDRSIQFFSSTTLPTGLVISAGGILSGTPTEYPSGGSGTFSIIATTGYSTLSRTYAYTMVGDQILIVQANGSDSITTIFSDVQYRAVLYSSDSFVNATFSIGALSPSTSATISVTSGGLVSGNFTGAALNTTYSATLTAVYASVTTNTLLYIDFTSFSGSGTGTIHIPTELSTLSFSQPTQTDFTLFEYVSYSIPIQAIGSASFIYYYSSAIPNGFEFLKNNIGTTATLSGISATIANQGIIIYAKTENGYPVSISISLRTITPFFVSPQIGAGAYTALLKNDVLGNAAQNARDSRTFPEVNPLAGPLMAPRAPDVVTPDNCILNLCKKPCPTCRTMM
jgi:hypothetical protein